MSRSPLITAHLVEDVEVPLAGVLVDHAGLLQQEVGDHAARGLARVKQNLHVLALIHLLNSIQVLFNEEINLIIFFT